ncbi:hypothetical protein Lesp02_67640 [Lentzea sp. NBRC 105346]|uniref:nSTAND1 domain-containing NTPase n=1 Tax=Lentzea sp. NBRC 105346 TaxID=3032205 RepID=UPI0024A18001|nr:XRE family transcriptional regulator [Lentzea sp. NBRC 105346]GLZ34577.1 hypothetical protein Lesp02_67640 [Lentzea sp. NBRC 105346]
MPRGERPLGGDGGALSQFAGDLRKLRDRAGKPSYRELARLAHYSATALSEAAGGRKLPSLAVTLAYVSACNGDVEEWESRWREIAAEESQEIAAESPYVGLLSFQPEDVDRFFGRERLTVEVGLAVRERSFVGLFGASGSGKSSVLRAGLVPRLNAPALVFTPGPRPLEECATRLAEYTGTSAVDLREELARDPANLRRRIERHCPGLVLVVDQFEEVFTQAAEPERQWLIKALTGAPKTVIGVRADFYGHCGRHPELVDALRGGQVLVGPMTPDELRRAITEPAARLGVKVETALVARLVADVAGQAAALPLVSHAMAETWRRRRGMTLTLTAYVEAGGVEHAVARTAEAAFSSLSNDEQRCARLLFLRLIALGEGTEDTKRRVPRAELDIADSLLDQLAAARLISLDRESAELTHEALIRSWPRLRDWIAENRDRLRTHRQLVDATAVWEADGRDPDALYRGVRLTQAEALGDLIGCREREFLDASAELAREHQAEERRHTHRLHQFVVILAVVVLLLGGTAVYAFLVQREATKAADAAMSQRGALEATLRMGSEPHAAARTALAAYSAAPTDQARDALLSAYAASRRALAGPPATFGGAAPVVAPGGNFLVARDGSGILRLWSLSGYNLVTRGPLGNASEHIVFSADGRYLAVHDESYNVQIWDVGDPDHPRRIRDIAGPMAVSGLDLATGVVVANRMIRDADGKWQPRSPAMLWDLRGPEPEQIFVGGDLVKAVAIHGDLIAVVRNDMRGAGFSVELHRLGGGRVPEHLSSVTAKIPYFEAVTFSPGGRFLVVQGNNQAEVWDLSDVDTPWHWLGPADVSAGGPIGFGADDTTLLAMSGDVLRLYSLRDQGQLRELGTITSTMSGFWRVTAQSPTSFVAQSTTPSGGLLLFSTDVDQVVRTMCADPFYYVSEGDWARLFPDTPRRSVCR